MHAPRAQHVSTLFLKTVLILIGMIVLDLCIAFVPAVWQEASEWPGFERTLYNLAFIGIYGAAIPFFYALYQAFTLLQYIDRNNAFSTLSIAALRNIKFSAIAMSVCYALALPLAYLVAELDDAPGLIPISTAFACAPLVIATFAAVLQKLVQNALDMKTENDFTI